MDEHRKLKAVLAVYMRNEKYYYDRYTAVLTRHKTRTCQFCACVISSLYIKHKCGKCSFNSCDGCAKHVRECKLCLMIICDKCSPIFTKCSYCNASICYSCMKNYDGPITGHACLDCENKRCDICLIPQEKRLACTIGGIVSVSKNICKSCSDDKLFSFCSSCGDVVQTIPTTYNNLCTMCGKHALCEECKANIGITSCKFCIDKKLRMLQANDVCVLVYKNSNHDVHQIDKLNYLNDMGDLNDSDDSYNSDDSDKSIQ